MELGDLATLFGVRKRLPESPHRAELPPAINSRPQTIVLTVAAGSELISDERLPIIGNGVFGEGNWRGILVYSGERSSAIRGLTDSLL
jgi:hypothetical protein